MSFTGQFCHAYFQEFNDKHHVFQRMNYFGIALFSCPLLVIAIPIWLLDACFNFLLRLSGVRDHWLEKPPEISYDILQYFIRAFNPDSTFSHERREEYALGIFLYFPFVGTAFLGAVTFGGLALVGKICEFIFKVIVFGTADLAIQCCRPKDQDPAKPTKTAVKARPPSGIRLAHQQKKQDTHQTRKHAPGTPHTGDRSQEDPPSLEEESKRHASTPPSSTDSGSPGNSQDGKMTPPKIHKLQATTEPAAQEDSVISDTASIASHPPSPKPVNPDGTWVGNKKAPLVLIPTLLFKDALKKYADPSDSKPEPSKATSHAHNPAALHGKPRVRKVDERRATQKAKTTTKTTTTATTLPQRQVNHASK